MRRQRERAAAVERAAEWSGARQQEPARAPLRQVQWSSYYHRFFGRVRPGDRVPSGVQPLSLDESAQTLHDVYCTADHAAQDKRRQVARRCVSQMLIYGYRPATEELKTQFDKLVTTAAKSKAAEPPPDPRELADTARDFLLRWGVRQFTPEQWSPTRRTQELNRAAANKERIVARPTELMHDHGAFVVTKQVYLNATVAEVSHLINPENWERLGEFFARTFREGGPEDSLATARANPWQGVLREDFICSWNGFTTNIFKQRLKVDYTVAPSIARTDYALMYEEDDQIVVNDGFFEVKAHEVPGDGPADDPPLPGGWIVGTMRKRLKFTSSVLNLLCPALLPMFLDSQASGFNKFFEE